MNQSRTEIKKLSTHKKGSVIPYNFGLSPSEEAKPVGHCDLGKVNRPKEVVDDQGRVIGTVSSAKALYQAIEVINTQQ